MANNRSSLLPIFKPIIKQTIGNGYKLMAFGYKFTAADARAAICPILFSLKNTTQLSSV